MHNFLSKVLLKVAHFNAISHFLWNSSHIFLNSTCVSPHDIDAAAARVHVAADGGGGRDEDELRFAVGRESLFFLVLYFDSRTLKIL